jgi:hypothetical protein
LKNPEIGYQARIGGDDHVMAKSISRIHGAGRSGPLISVQSVRKDLQPASFALTASKLLSSETANTLSLESRVSDICAPSAASHPTI